MNKFTLLLIATAAIAGISSCNDNDDPDQIITGTLPKCYSAYVTDGNVNNYTAGNDISYAIEYNNTRKVATVAISGVAIPGGASYPTFTVSNLPFTTSDDGSRVISASGQFKGTFIGGAGQASITDFNLTVKDRIISSTQYTPAVAVKFTIDGVTVYSSHSPFVFTGTTVSVAEGVAPYTTTETGYIINVDLKNRKASVDLKKAIFSSGMPQPFDMVFDGIDVALRADGSLQLTADNITPSIGGRPFPTFPITDFKCDLDPADEASITFVCTVKGVPFTVTADLNQDQK